MRSDFGFGLLIQNLHVFSVSSLQNVAICATIVVYLYLDRKLTGVYNKNSYGKEKIT